MRHIRSDILRQPCIPIGFLNDLNRCVTEDDVFAAYAQWSGCIIKADRTAIAIASVDERVLDLMAIDGNKAIETGVRMPFDGTLIGHVFQTQVAAICPDLAKADHSDTQLLSEAGLLYSMLVPLSAGDRKFGVLAQAFASPPAPSDEDLALLQTIANCLGSHLLLQEQIVQLGEMAMTDPLTRVYNRRVYEDRLGLLWSKFKTDGDRFCVALVDLDHFKQVNDAYGHPFGDHVLKTVAETLINVSRPGDTVVRMGGEEFCVVLENTEIEQACGIVERLRSAIERLTFPHMGQDVKITASIGVASAKDAHDSPRLVSLLADRALYCAKSEGRNRVVKVA